LAERKINLPPRAQIKLAWKVHSPHQIQLEKKNLLSNRPPPPPGQKAGDSFIKIFWALKFGGTVLLKLIWVSQLHRERVVIGRVFQALPTQTNTTVALIYQLHRERAVTRRIFQALPTQIDTIALIYRILFGF